jgi:hypothetical protein
MKYELVPTLLQRRFGKPFASRVRFAPKACQPFWHFYQKTATGS